MRPGHAESPFNPLPPVLWALAVALILPEIAFFVGGAGGIGGNTAAGMRTNAIQMTAWVPDLVLMGWPGAIRFDQFYRLLTYPFVAISPMGTLFVVAFTLALGKAVSTAFRPWAVLAIFFGASDGGALVHTALVALPGMVRMPLVGGYPAAYGLIGAFTWLLWMRLRATGGNPARAFLLIGALILFQASFAIIYRQLPGEWIAEFAGFGIGFFLCFLVAPGALRRLRQR